MNRGIAMRAVVQRVKASRVVVSGETIASIGHGVLILLGVGSNDAEKDCDYLANKIVHLRIFPDENGQMNLSLSDVKGEVMVVSQFTLWADCRKGRRPSFTRAAPPDKAIWLYEHFVRLVREKGFTVKTGQFQAMMEVSLVNDGPVTLMLDSEKQF